jgi:hypothetical protein
MTAHKTVILVCDGCGSLALSSPTMAILDLINLMHPITSVAEAREHARAKLWRLDKRGRDLCPNCQGDHRPPTPGKFHVITDHFHRRHG